MESALVEAIPAMAVHSAALPFVNRALTQLPPRGEHPCTTIHRCSLTLRMNLKDGVRST